MSPFQRLVVPILFLCNIPIAQAANYYFSSLTGDDLRTPLQAQNPNTPWKTLGKLNSYFSELKPGDTVFLKKGQTFYGSISVKTSGTLASPIVISSYGSGKKPVITSFITASGWVSKGRGLYECTDPSFGSRLNMLLLNGVQYGMGRFPNKEDVNNGYLNFESYSGDTAISDSDYPNAIDWTGAELVIRKRHWILEKRKISKTVTNSDSTTFYYPGTEAYNPWPGYGYFIQNSVKTLDKFGEWYYNPSLKKLSVYFGTTNPSAYLVEAATLDSLVSSVRYSNVVFENLAIKGANGSGFTIRSGSGIKVQNCAILFSGENGVSTLIHTNFTIENCTIQNQNNNGIDIETGDGAIIRNNKILNTHLIAGMGMNGDGTGIGIMIISNNSIIEYNVIINTAYHGIHFHGDNVTIKNNLIDTFCNIKDDGAGIYSNNYKNRNGDGFKKRKLIGNIILNGLGSGKGTDNPLKVATHGIYVDNNASEASFTGNTIANCTSGMYIHNSNGMIMEKNTTFNNSLQLNMNQDPSNVSIINCKITNNLLFAKLDTQLVLSLKSNGDSLTNFGKFDNNCYARPLNDRLTIFTSYSDSKGKWIPQYQDLEGWQALSGQDRHSIKSAKSIAPYTINRFIGESKFPNVDFNENLRGVFVTNCLRSHEFLKVLDSGYLKAIPDQLAKKKSSVYVNIGSIDSGKNYILRYSQKGTRKNGTSIKVFLRKTGYPYTTFPGEQQYKIGTLRKEVEMLFSPLFNDSSVSVVFEVDQKDTFYLDNIRFHEAIVKITNPDDSIKFHYNASLINKTIFLKGYYMDAWGNEYLDSIVLPPFTSTILIANSAKNIAPTISITSPGNNAVFPPFSTITITADAADKDGSVATVEFYNGSDLLKRDTKAPYDCTLKNLAIGIHTLTAKATDDRGLTVTSSPVVILARPVNTPPVVNITSPVNNATFTAPATIEIKATATDSGGAISKVEFFNGSALLLSERRAPYFYSWQNVPAGVYAITAKATDTTGLATISEVITITVRAEQPAENLTARRTSDEPGVSVPADLTVKNKQGNSAGTNIGGGKVLSQPKLSALPALRVSPNPAVNEIHILADGLPANSNATLTIQNVSGAIWKKYPVIISRKVIDVDITSLLPGMYIIYISTDGVTVNRQFVKVH